MDAQCPDKRQSCTDAICCMDPEPAPQPQPVSCLANYNCAPQEDIVGAMCPDG